MNQKIIPFLFHPITLSLLVTLLIFLIFPVNIPKYLLKIEDSSRWTKPDILLWEDLEKDGISDKVFFGNELIGYAVTAVYFQPSGRVKEWDIPGKMVSGYNKTFFVIGSSSSNKTKEIFVFTQSHDSVFLNRINDFSGQKPVWKQKLIATTRIVNRTNDLQVVSPRLDDLDNDGKSELVFGLSAGFSIAPRAMFIYYPATDSLRRSIETGNFLVDFIIADINSDGNKEIITSGYAPKNILDTLVQFHDSSNWAMAFDHHLNLLFPPPEFQGRTGGTSPFVSPDESSDKKLYILWFTPTNNKHGPQLYQINGSGDKKLVKEFSEFEKQKSTGDCMFYKIHGTYKFIIPTFNGDVFLFDTAFQKHDLISINQPISHLKLIDVDLDGQDEILTFDLISRRLTVFRENFTNPSTISLELSDLNKTTISLRKNKQATPLISITTGNLYYLLSYHVNPLWYTRWGIWAVIWVAVFLFTLLIRRIQKLQDEKRFATEKKITELQMKIVRNQMDPHFTMNAINAVVDAINREEKEEARDNLLHFSKMYRSLVLSADKIKRPLCEELEFTQNYLALEKFRFGNRFTYEIELDEEVDLFVEVPKMVIQSPVENAVKHGLLKRESGGQIHIHAYREKDKLILEITDNGIGREQSSKSEKTSTGKGTRIMEQFFDLYYKITGIRVTSEITDLNDADTGKTGTKVRTVVQR